MTRENNDAVWVCDNDGDYIPAHVKLTQRLPAGMYEWRNGGLFSRPFLHPVAIVEDEIIAVAGAVSEKVADEIKRFWDNKEAFIRNGFVWKRGILLYGPPGSGKTATSQLVAQWAIAQGAVVVNAEDEDEVKLSLKMIREVEPERPVIVIMEEVDTFDESDLLSVLDGTHQSNNVVYIGTTNYPEKLSDRLKNRPSRFDCVLLVDFPNDAERDSFLKGKSERLAQNEVERAKWVRSTKGFAYSHMRELIALVECMLVPFDDAVQRLYSMWNPDMTSAMYQDRLRKRGTEE